MKRTFITNGRVVTPDEVKKTTIVIENGKIADDDYRAEIPEGAKVVDAEGMYVSPGFVETHVHGGDGFDFMDCTPEAFEKVADLHYKHGTTSIMPTADACSEEALLNFCSTYRAVKDKSRKVSFIGLHLEGPFLSQAMKGAQPEGFIRNPSQREVDRLMDEAGDLIGRCTAAPEIDGIEYMAKEMKKRNIVLSCGHSDATCDQMERAYDMGFDHMTHMYCSTPTVRKINQVIYAGAREAAYLIDGVRIELIGDGHHVAKQVLQIALKFKGADMINLTTDAIRATGLDVTETYLGEVSPENRIIIEDGVAKLPDRSSYAGSIATSDVMLKWAVQTCGVSIPDAVKMLALTPARIVGVGDRKGSIEKGKDADILFINDNLDVCRVFSSNCEE